MNRQVIIAKSYPEAIRAANMARVPHHRITILTPITWRNNIRGLTFTASDIIWGNLGDNQEFGPAFWDALDAILAIAPKT